MLTRVKVLLNTLLTLFIAIGNPCINHIGVYRVSVKQQKHFIYGHYVNSALFSSARAVLTFGSGDIALVTATWPRALQV